MNNENPPHRRVPDRPSDAPTEACAACCSMLWRTASYICPDPTCRYGVTGPIAAAPPAEAPGEARFFLDHGVVHDRKTGRHVGAAFEDDSADRLLALLCELENDAVAWRMTAKALAAAPAAPAVVLPEKLRTPLYGDEPMHAIIDYERGFNDCVDQVEKLNATAPRVTGGREVEAGFREGYKVGYGDGLTDGHPLGSGSRHDADGAWRDSDANAALQAANGGEG